MTRTPTQSNGELSRELKLARRRIHPMVAPLVLLHFSMFRISLSLQPMRENASKSTTITISDGMNCGRLPAPDEDPLPFAHSSGDGMIYNPSVHDITAEIVQ